MFKAVRDTRKVLIFLRKRVSLVVKPVTSKFLIANGHRKEM